MSEIIVKHENPDNIVVSLDKTVKFIGNKLYQYQWSQDESLWAWYLVIGQKEKDNG